MIEKKIYKISILLSIEIGMRESFLEKEKNIKCAIKSLKCPHEHQQHEQHIKQHFCICLIFTDLISASLENAIASTGGFCAGRSFVIGHQRLSGEAINIIQEQPDIPQILRQKSIALHRLILSATDGLRFVVIGDEISPLKHIGFEHEDKALVEQVLDDFVSELQTIGILVSRACYLSDQEAFSQKATVKVTCRVDVTDEEMEEVGGKFRFAMKKLNRND
uniref:Uncharacterized protein n=1 Tax=Meloidogyne hapla TaxID=6305 RepID=A0A1I8BGD5_MELHA